MFRHRIQLRLWAARVLLAWIFAMGAGVANACLSSAAPEHAAVGEAHRSEDSGSHHGGAAAPHGVVDPANCVEFCDRAAVSIPTQKSASGDLQAHPVICVVAATVLSVPVLDPARVSAPRRDGVRALPIPILMAFLRLAL